MPNTSISPDLHGFKFDDYRQDIAGDSFNWSFVRQLSQIIKIAVHHSVTRPSQSDTPRQQADVLANIHINSNGWGGIGYHLVVAKDGTVLYVGDVATGRANITGNNEKIIGICLIGDFTKEVPTQEQIVSLHHLINYFLTARPDMPNINTWDDVIGHKDAVNLWAGATATECPGAQWGAEGDNLHDRLKDIKFDGYPRWDTNSPMPALVVVTPPPPPVVVTPPAPPVLPPVTPPASPITPMPTSPIPPVSTPVLSAFTPQEYDQLKGSLNSATNKLNLIKVILVGKGFWWTKLASIRSVVN